MSGFVNSSYHTSFWDTFFLRLPRPHEFGCNCLRIYTQSYIFRGESFFLFGQKRVGTCLALHQFLERFLSFLLFQIISKIECLLTADKPFWPGSNVRRIEFKTSCIYFVYFEYVLLIAAFARIAVS